ncbi:hypothetical protein [Microvirga rosea]|uniref:hypothetical protein n=1 Tax=Microvirga rosea TaxID=2715425 RepID=UPI001D0BABCE|nr:hypothetical protein [Microvirga rosea]MCB8820092.1 hypothetical protein [Microvirga rosea]
MGNLTFNGRGPYDLPNATHANARRDGDGIILSFRLWKSESEWTVVQIRVNGHDADKLARRIGDIRMSSDGSAII